MKDPWRVVDDVRKTSATVETSRQKISPFEIDFDWDLRPSISCVLRFKACSIEVQSRDLQTPRDALEALAKTIIELRKAKANLHYAFAQHGKAMDLPPTEARTARLECGDVTVWFLEKTLDEGALWLVRDLIKARRDPRLSPILSRHGITPMLRA